MHLKSIESAPSGTDYLRARQEEESGRSSHSVVADALRMTSTGQLQFDGRIYDVLNPAEKDLAKAANIPTGYFSEIDLDLRAHNFNARISAVRGMVHVTVSNDNAVQGVHREKLTRIPSSDMIQILLEEAPADTESNDIRAVEYNHNHLDLALISPSLQSEPRNGDVIYGGVHLTIEPSGAVQVGPESFRLVCMNGAMARVCAGGHHRLRRGLGRDSERRFLKTFREFAVTAWRDWERVKCGLEDLAHKALSIGEIDSVIRGLRSSPFFISARAAARVAEQLRQNAENLTYYDLHNAITYVGTHESEVLPQYRYRLRLGAGQLARGRVGVCQACRRLMIGDGASRN